MGNGLANGVVSQIHAHRSVRQYTDDPVRDEDIVAAVAAGQAAATSSAVQPYSVLRITDMDKRAKIAQLCGPQAKVQECPEFFIFCADLRRHALIFKQAGKTYDQRLEVFMIAVIDTSLLAQNVVLAFESMGYGTCYIGGLRNNLPEVDEVLGLPQLVCPIYGLCVGRPAQEPQPRPRLATEAILFENSYPDDETILASVAAYDTAYKAYMEARGAKPNTWSQAILSKFASVMRPGLAAYYTSKGIRLD